jgi:hypothetical protein
VKPSCAVMKLIPACGAGRRAPENLARAGQALRQRADAAPPVSQKARTSSRKRSFHSLQPGREATEVVTVRAEIPRLGDQLDAREQRILAHGREEGAVTRQGCGEIEAEAVDVHFPTQ